METSAQRPVKQKSNRRLARENVRHWSELLSLCLNTSQTSADLALRCAQQLLNDVTIDSGPLIRLQSIAHRNQMNWTADNASGSECIVRLEHSLFAVDIRIDICTDEIEQVCLVDQSSRTSCSQMLDCLKANDYAQFERHLRGFIALREKGSLLLEAERALSETYKCQVGGGGHSYWDLLPEFGHFCPRMGGIPPKFYYFVSPKVFVTRQHRTKQELIEQEGYYFSLTTKEGVLRMELEPPLRCCTKVLQTLLDIECVSEVKSTTERRLLSKDANAMVIKVYKPSFGVARSVAIPQICSIGAIVRQFKMQAFLHEILDLSELPLCTSTVAGSNDEAKFSQVEIFTKPDCTIGIYFPALDHTHPYTKVRYDGQRVVIDDVEKSKLEFVFKKVPSLISLLRLVQGRCTELNESSRCSVATDHSPATTEKEVSLNAVFNSVIERFTARPPAPTEKPLPIPAECETASAAEEVLASVPEEKTVSTTRPVTPKIKIKPIMSPPALSQPEEAKKKRKGRKPKAERVKSETAEQSETKRVEPLRIKISSLSTSKRGKSGPESGVKRHQGRKRLAERKGRVVEENEKQHSEVKEEKCDVNTESLNMLNDDKKKSSLSHFKIPRKKAPQEISSAPPRWERSPASQQPPRYRPQSILSEPLPSTPQCYPSLDRSSSLSPQIGPNNRTLFPSAFQPPPASPRLRQPSRPPFSPALGYPTDVRHPRYRMTRTGCAHEFRFR